MIESAADVQLRHKFRADEFLNRLQSPKQVADGAAEVVQVGAFFRGGEGSYTGFAAILYWPRSGDLSVHNIWRVDDRQEVRWIADAGNYFPTAAGTNPAELLGRAQTVLAMRG